MKFIYNKYVFLFLFITFFIKFTNAQNTIKTGDLEARFLKDQVEVEQGKSFFDILYLKNKTNRPLSFNVQFNTPKDWNFIGNKLEKITLTPYGEASIPVRVTLSQNTNGGVGYAVVAMISDAEEEGSVYNTVYAFVKIPVISNIKIKTSNTSGFFNQKSLKSSFEISLINSGNIDEIVNIHFIPDPSLTVNKDHEQIKYDNIEIKPGENLNLNYNVRLNEDTDYKKYRIHKLKISFKVKDSLIDKTIWFKYIDWKYRNTIPDSKKPLNIELVASNIFGKSSPYYYGRLYGNILLKGNKDIYYSFRNYQRNNTDNYWINSQNEIRLTGKTTTIFLGDYTGNLEHSMYGRGIAVTQKIGLGAMVKAVYTKKLNQNYENYGFSYAQNFSKGLSSEIGGVYVKDSEFNNNSQLIFGRINTLFSKNKLTLLLGKSFSSFPQYSNTNYSGWGLRSELYGKYNRVSYKLKSDYGSSYYVGYLYGTLNSSGTINFNLLNNRNLSLQYVHYRYQPGYVYNNTYHNNRHTSVQKISPVLNIIKNNTQLYINPIFEEANTNSFSAIDTSDIFSSYSSQIQLGIRKINKYADYSFNLSVKYGLTSIYKYPLFLNGVSYENRTGEKTYTTAQIRTSFKNKNFGVSMAYYLGPYSISQQFAYFYTYIYSKSLILIPYYEHYFFDNKIKVSIYGSYVNNLSTKGSRSMLSPRIEWFAGKGWSFNFLNTSSISRVAESSTMYSSTYFEFGLKKSFDIQQPRIKFYDYQAVFYKDLNGNRIHDDNEPGVADVLAEITRANPEEDLKNKNYNGDFLANQLYSNEEGKIEYDNIAEGKYIIKFIPKGMHDKQYDSDESIREFTANKDTVMYIPFMERNKLFGKISLHRSKHSALGDIPLDNIKITVEGNDKTYSTLTDENGNFEMYIPVSDYYTVKINNIFREHFNLRKESYIVKFNGYKQFELSFDFDEKERKIHFDESDFLITDEDEANTNINLEDIKIIKQTNLRGIIKDANSLLPIHATVSIYNNRTHELISETASSRRTGVYFTSFFAGDNYTIKVIAKGYWAYSEDLYINQITTFNNVNRDVLLKKIYIDEEIKTDNLKFRSENSELSALAEAELNNLLSTLFANPDVIIEVGGHVDDMEALTVNGRQLSEARAKTVANYLQKHGLSSQRIKIKALSNNDPKSREDTPEGRAQNRRVSIKVAGF